MAHEADLSVDDVVSSYDGLLADGARPFFLLRGGLGGGFDELLVGDADVRHVAGETGEFAIMIGNRTLQGRGLGWRFAVMVHVFAFWRLGLRRMYVSIIPDNVASRSLFEKLGYERDDRPQARLYVDDQTDVTMSLDRERFEIATGEITDIRIRERAECDREG